MLLALVAAGLANVMQGVERFVGAAVATAASSTVFLVFAAVLLANGRGLVALGQAAVAQYVVGVVLRVWMLRDLLAVAPFGRMPGDHARALLSFAARMQINVASTLINSQTDKVVVGLVSSTRAVGQVGIGSQVAEALRFVCFAALGPLLARMAIVQGEGGGARLIVFYQQVSRLWLPGVAGFTAIACAAMFPLIAAWLGPGYGTTALLRLSAHPGIRRQRAHRTSVLLPTGGRATGA